jgi:hypothetical protein
LKAPGGTPLPDPIIQAIAAGKRVEAVKLMRATFGLSLLDALHAVDKAPDLLPTGQVLTRELLGIESKCQGEPAA